MKNAMQQQAQIGERILSAVKTRLYLNMRFLSQALGMLGHESDLNTVSLGTDAVSIRFNPRYLIEVFLNRPEKLERIYMHCLVHCLFGHMFSAEKYNDEELWDLSCDIAAESVIDSMDNEMLYRVSSDDRQRWYGILSEKLRVLSAEQIYGYLSRGDIPYEDILRLRKEFSEDDHSFWKRLSGDGSEPKEDIPEDIQFIPESNLPLKEEWESAAERIRIEMEVSGSEVSRDFGRLIWMLKLSAAEHTPFEAFLRNLMITKEEIGVDPDAFDMAYYNLGMSLYGNMPLIEEVELVERHRIETLIIAIDTSASTKRRQVRHFLESALAILTERSNFFTETDIHIIECDDMVQSDLIMHSSEEIKDYIDSFSVRGGYGTDFRPVFEYVSEMIDNKTVSGLKGLLYFTDGYGNFPEYNVPYDVGFVFVEGEDYDDTGVPPWAVKLYIRGDFE